MNGYCDVVILGNGFPKPLENKFLHYAELVKANLLKREPFKSRADKLRFHIFNPKGNLDCRSDGTVGEMALVCSTEKIKTAIKKELGSLLMNVALVLSWKDGNAGANGAIAAVGLNEASDVNAQCGFEFRAFDGISIHELGHTFGCGHDFDRLNIMYFGTNGGCVFAGQPFTSEHQAIINQFIDKAITT